jgi:hypothetical protein
MFNFLSAAFIHFQSVQYFVMKNLAINFAYRALLSLNILAILCLVPRSLHNVKVNKPFACLQR